MTHNWTRMGKQIAAKFADRRKAKKNRFKVKRHKVKRQKRTGTTTT